MNRRSRLSPATRRYRIRIGEGVLYVEPPIAALSRLRIVRHIVADNPNHGWQITRESDPIARRLTRNIAVYPRALLPVIVSLMNRHGHTIDLIYRDVACQPLVCHLSDDSPATVGPEDVGWISDHLGGLIHFRAGLVDPNDYLVAIVRAFRDARVAIVGNSIHRNRCVASRLRQHGIPVAYASSGRMSPDEARVVVTTYGGLEGAEVEQRDIVIALAAQESLGSHAQASLRRALRARLFGFLAVGTRLSKAEMQDLQLLFGLPGLSLLRPNEHDRQVEVVWQRIDGRLKRVSSVLELRRRGIWRHKARNQSIARVVRESVPIAQEPANTTAASESRVRRVLILVENVEHAAAVAEFLPACHVEISDAAHLDGLNERDRRRLADGQLCTMTAHTIVTHAAFESVDLAEWDALIRADGGVDIGLLDRDRLLSRHHRSEPLMLVDFYDRSHPELRRNSKRRRRAYAQQGWFDRGVDPFSAQVDQFIDSFGVHHER